MNTAKTHDELAYLLVSRGMGSSHGLSPNELTAQISEQLASVNYYRMAAYWYQFRIPRKGKATPSKAIVKGTAWEDVVEYYRFDRRLRILLFEAISRIEIALREKIAESLSSHDRTIVNPQNDANLFRKGFKEKREAGNNAKRTCYICPLCENGSDQGEVQNNESKRPSLYADMMFKIQRGYCGNKGDAAKHYRDTKHIANVRNLPVWVFLEYATFGNLSMLLSAGMKTADVASIAATLGFISRPFFVSVISLLHQVRNECAHQGRIWNRLWTHRDANKVEVPILKTPDRAAWQYLKEAEADTTWETTGQESLLRSASCTAAAIVACHTLMKQVAPNNSWTKRMFAIFDDCPLNKMAWEVGFCHKDWQSHRIWQ